MIFFADDHEPVNCLASANQTSPSIDLPPYSLKIAIQLLQNSFQRTDPACGLTDLPLSISVIKFRVSDSLSKPALTSVAWSSALSGGVFFFQAQIGFLF